MPSSEEGGLRADAAHLVVLDGFLDDASCASIFQRLAGDAPGPAPPGDRWERRTADSPSAPLSWGLTDAAMAALESHPPAGVTELLSRLAVLYPELEVCHQPSSEAAGALHAASACGRCVANAAVAGDAFTWHVDADPSSLPASSRVVRELGEYSNRDRGKPLWASALLYLDAPWPEAYDAETLFLDPPTGTGVFVRPRRGRLVLMDQDVTHRMSPPSAQAGRPRYSLVLKLVLRPRDPAHRPSLARPEWGRPAAFGSAARLEAVSRALPPRKRPAEGPSQEAAAAKRAHSGEARGVKRRSEDAAEDSRPAKAQNAADRMEA